MVAALRLELNQAPGRVTGTVLLALPTAVPETGDVVGRVSQSGELALDGTLFRASGSGLIESGRLERWSTHIGRTGDELMGSFIERSFSFGTIQVEIEWTLVEVTRTAGDPRSSRDSASPRVLDTHEAASWAASFAEACSASDITPMFL
jgi:hypothetical protein